MFSFRIYGLAVIMSFIVAGCAVGPDFRSPEAPQTKGYTASPLPSKTVSAKSPSGQSQHFRFAEDIPAEWWRLYRCPELDTLIRLGIKNSPNMKAAQAALREAQSNLRAGIGSLFPLITGNISAERERFAGSSLGIGRDSEIFSLYTGQVNVTYTLDVFGGIRRQIEALGAQVDFQYFELEATYLTLTSNIVTTAVNEASLRAQIQATHELIASQSQTLKIIDQQFELGAVSRTAILSQQTQLAQTQATLPPLEKALAQTRHALAVLVGVLPSESRLPEFSLNNLHLPVNLPISVPSNLVRQRPDIQASEALLHAASAQIGVTTANLLPQFPLTAQYGRQSNQLNTFFEPRAIFWNYGAQVVQTLFDAGTLSAQRRAAIAAFEQAGAQYEQTVLVAFQNVADALRALEFDAKALRIQSQAEIAAKSNLKLTQQQFQLGAIDYLSLLNAEYQYQQTRIGRIQAQGLRFSDTAALFQALGGGWWNRGPIVEKPPQPNSVQKAFEQLL